MLSITSDYQVSDGCPEPYLRAVANAGFTHVHWCHHWCTDFLYSRSEVEQIGKWLEELGLRIVDLHASSGKEKNWLSPREYERQAGIELVSNRIEMVAELGGDVIIMHVPQEPDATGERPPFWDRLRGSLDALQPLAVKRAVRIALENLGSRNFGVIEKLFSMYGPGYLGLCYDSGHGNMTGDGLDWLDKLKDRLISLHLHDNDGEKDEHKLPFTGTIDWEKLARLIGQSSYAKCVSMESVIGNTGIEDGDEFLRQAFEFGTKLSDMIEQERGGR